MLLHVILSLLYVFIITSSESTISATCKLRAQIFVIRACDLSRCPSNLSQTLVALGFSWNDRLRQAGYTLPTSLSLSLFYKWSVIIVVSVDHACRFVDVYVCSTLSGLTRVSSVFVLWRATCHASSAQRKLPKSKASRAGT